MFFEVKAKCGHVGKHNYVIKNFYTRANCAKEAAKKIRFAPRVKHDRKDAILEVKEIDYQDYKNGVLKNKNDEYFNIHNSSDQKRIFTGDIFREEYREDRQKRDVAFKRKKWQIIEKETRKMVLGELYYG